METIKELGDDIGRKNDPSIFTETVADKSLDKKLTTTDNQSNSPPCVTSENKCVLTTSETTSECNDQDNDLRANNNVSGIFYNFKLTMLLQYSKECLGFIALILTTYATLLNKEPITGGTVAPKPIFSLGSIVQEWPYGNLVDVQVKVAASELSLIYFYAPWCAESLSAKKVYNSVANLYSKEAYFAAVNCWQPNSSCRTLYANVYKWPVLMAYLPNGLSVQYNGDWNFNSLAAFIDGLLNPIVRIHNTKELLHLRIVNDAVVFGVFNSSDTKEFQIFFQTAIKWLESNLFQNTKFAVYVGKEISMFAQSQNIQAPVINLFTQNVTHVYDNIQWTSKTITYFVKQYLTESSIWINLPSLKSATIHKYLQKGPVLLMFSPRVSHSNHYFIMKQLIYSYNNNRHDLNNSVLNEYITHIKREYPIMLSKLTHFCDFSRREQRQHLQTTSFDIGVWGDSVFSMGVQNVNTSKYVSMNSHVGNIGTIDDYEFKSCKNDVFQNTCIRRNFHKLDYQSPSEILRNYLQKKCFRMEKQPETLFEKAVVEPITSPELLNASNASNGTLTFLMLDSMVYNDYLKNFIGDHGFDEGSQTLSKLFIVDNNGETLHIQKGPISTTSTIEFVNDFVNGKLSRHLRSSTILENKTKPSDNSIISIKEINSLLFSKVIHRKNVTSVVLFYTPQCSLCYIMSQTLLHISHIIKLRNIKFYRIDASVNDVCWEYTMDEYPKLIIFPQNRSDDSNVFPSRLKVNVKNVFSFILSKLNSEQQLKSLINACILTKLSFAFQNCVRQIRVMINNEIGTQLSHWHRPSANRTLVLAQLRTFKGVYFELLRARKAEDLKYVLKDIVTYGS